MITLMCFAGAKADARLCKEAMSASHMRVDVSDDIAGAEICSAMKNAYATGLGLWDGTPIPFGGTQVRFRNVLAASAARFEDVRGSLAKLVADG